MVAYFFKAKAGCVLIVCSAPGEVHNGVEHKVAGKREARTLAKQLGAQCWNF